MKLLALALLFVLFAQSPPADLSNYTPVMTWHTPKAKPWQGSGLSNSGKCSDAPAGGAGWSGSLVWPVDSRYVRDSRLFANGNTHYAIDIDTPVGSNVYAAAGGLVVWSGFYGGGLGQMIVLAHGGTWQTFYAHLHEIFVQCGAVVSGGQVIALSGGGPAPSAGFYGLSTFPALHFEVRHGGLAGDPLRWLTRNISIVPYAAPVATPEPPQRRFEPQ